MGRSRGHMCGEKLEPLIGQEVLGPAELGSDDDLVYCSLVEGGFEATLDDGEAATSAYAVDHRADRRRAGVRMS